MKVLVCGGRRYTSEADYVLVKNVLDALHAKTPITCIINGGAKGIDDQAYRWVVETGRVWVWSFPADWKKHGRAAGPIRNKQMLDEGKPDLVLAFPGGKGTADMVVQANRAGVKVMTV